jgi:hypothetical protein
VGRMGDGFKKRMGTDTDTPPAQIEFPHVDGVETGVPRIPSFGKDIFLAALEDVSLRLTPRAALQPPYPPTHQSIVFTLMVKYKRPASASSIFRASLS